MSFWREIYLFLRSLTVAAHELINTTSGVDELALTGVEGVRSAFAFEFYGVISLCGRTRKEHIAVGHVLEHDGAIVFWMNTFFHFCLLLLIVICSLCIKAAAKVRHFFGLAKFSVDYFCNLKDVSDVSDVSCLLHIFWSALENFLECVQKIFRVHSKKYSTAWNKQYSALIVEGMPVVTHADVIYELCG